MRANVYFCGLTAIRRRSIHTIPPEHRKVRMNTDHPRVSYHCWEEHYISHQEHPISPHYAIFLCTSI